MVRGRPLTTEEKKEYDDKNRKRALHLSRAQRALKRNDLFTYKQERKNAGLEEKGKENTRKTLLDTAPKRPPPDRPDKIVRKTTDKPVVETSKFLFDQTSHMSGSIVNQELTSSEVSQAETYNDHLQPESQLMLEANDKEEFKGANPRENDSSDLKEINDLRIEEFKDDAQRVRDIVDEVEILSGGINDSLMDATDLVDENAEAKHDDDDDLTGHPDAGIERAEDAHRIAEVDLEHLDENLSDFFMEREDIVYDDLSSIGRRFGESIPHFRSSFVNDMDIQSVSSGDSIMDSISGLTSLSSQDGSWFSSDKDLESNIDMSERMNGMNKIAVNKDFRDNIGKYNPMSNANNRLMMSQGVSLGTINEMRSRDIKYKQPNRKIKSDAVNLVRLGNQTALKIQNEYAP